MNSDEVLMIEKILLDRIRLLEQEIFRLQNELKKDGGVDNG